MTPDLIAEMRTKSDLLDDALGYLRRMSGELANNEMVYREAAAKAWVVVDREGTTAAEREAMVKAATASQRRDRDLAEGMRQAALEAVRSRRTQISALQSIANADRAEAEISNWGPQVSP